MKKSALLLLLLLLSILMIPFSGCYKDDPPPFSYNLKLKFENETGENLIKGLKYDPDNKKVLYSEYKLISSGKYDIIQDEPLWIEIDDNGYEQLYMRNATFFHVAPTITHTLVCPHIFGNNEEHILISHWEKTEPEHSAACSKITFDGKEYPVVKSTDGRWGYEALIKLKRP